MVGQAGVFLLLVFALLGYVYFATAGQASREADAAVIREYRLLAKAYSSGGLRELNEQVVERSAAPGPLNYVLADPDGKVIAGDYDALPRLPAGGASEWITFPVSVQTDDGPETVRARAHMGRLLNGPVLFVARDLRESRAFAARMTRALTWAAFISVAFSVIAGFISAWLAARRVERLTDTTQQVMRGDLSRRAPVTGWGDEFDLLAQNLNDMLARLEKLVHATANAGDAIAHDLRTPLTRLRRQLDAALENPPDTEDDREALRRAQEETDRVLKTFTVVLQLARLKSADNWRFGRVELHLVVKEIVELYEPAAEEANVAMTSRCSPYLVVNGDAQLIAQALANLLDNALKYTPAGGRVHVSTAARADGRVEIRVADNGPGVPLHERERVKERFVRLEGHRTSPGVGLGLSLVAAVAELHGGDFLLEDGLGGADRLGLSAVLVLAAAPPPRKAAH